MTRKVSVKSQLFGHDSNRLALCWRWLSIGYGDAQFLFAAMKLEILFPILLTNENVRLQFSTAENEQCLKYTLLSSLVAQVLVCGRFLGKNIPNSYCRY